MDATLPPRTLILSGANAAECAFELTQGPAAPALAWQPLAPEHANVARVLTLHQTREDFATCAAPLLEHFSVRVREDDYLMYGEPVFRLE